MSTLRPLLTPCSPRLILRQLCSIQQLYIITHIVSAVGVAQVVVFWVVIPWLYSGWLDLQPPNIFDSYTSASKFKIHMKIVATLKVEVVGFSETLEHTHVLCCVWIQETFVWDGHITIEIVAFCNMIPCSLNVVKTSEVTLCVFFRIKLSLKFRVVNLQRNL